MMINTLYRLSMTWLLISFLSPFAIGAENGKDAQKQKATTEFNAFQRDILKNQTAPADLKILYDMQSQRIKKAGVSADPLEEIDATIINPGESLTLLDKSYLNEKDKANPDIMINVAATDAVFQYITFVAQNGDSDLIGYWHGPEHTPIQNAPIVKYDTEGQFSLLSGKNLTEALVGDRVFEDEKLFSEIKSKFSAAGITFVANKWDELAEPKAKTKPDELHHKLYNEGRVKKGLKPVD